jgi:hypothetical protein
MKSFQLCSNADRAKECNLVSDIALADIISLVLFSLEQFLNLFLDFILLRF